MDSQLAPANADSHENNISNFLVISKIYSEQV